MSGSSVPFTGTWRPRKFCSFSPLVTIQAVFGSPRIVFPSLLTIPVMVSFLIFVEESDTPLCTRAATVVAFRLARPARC